LATLDADGGLDQWARVSVLTAGLLAERRVPGKRSWSELLGGESVTPDACRGHRARPSRRSVPLARLRCRGCTAPWLDVLPAAGWRRGDHVSGLR